MKPLGRFSVRARLTLSFMVAVAVVLGFAAVALVGFSHHTLVRDAQSQVEAAITRTESRLASVSLPRADEMIFETTNNVVVQVTNLAGTKVWAASSTLENKPALAYARATFSEPNGLRAQLSRNLALRNIVSQLHLAAVAEVHTSKGTGLVYAFFLGNSIANGERSVLVAALISFPLILLVVGALIWLGVGLSLSPVERIRRRALTIVAQNLAQRLPDPGGNDEIARAIRTVNAMLDRFEISTRLEHEFMSNASHELRSPLTTLLATVDRAAAGTSTISREETIAVIQREGHRLETLIDDLFWLARNDEGRPRPEPTEVDLDDLLFDEVLRAKSLSALTFDVARVQPTRVVGNHDFLARMIRNAVDNAMRYAERAVNLTSNYDGPMAVITVHNDGTGLDVDQSQRYFERFVRADSARSRLTGGSGLGLAIVKEIVTVHGGTARFLPVAEGTSLELRILR